MDGTAEKGPLNDDGHHAVRELFRRLLARPGIAVELTISSLFVNVLGLAQSLFVMQVLNRYVAYGVDATLATLTTGVLIAVALEFAFRQARLSVARGVSVGPDEKVAIEGFEALTRAKVAAVDQIPPDTRREMVGGVAAIESAYNANNVTTILDVPFAIVFVFVLYLLKPMLALVAVGFLLAVFALGVYSSLAMQDKTSELQQETGVGSGLLGTVTREGDTVRCFNAGEFLRQAWRKHVSLSQRLRRIVTARQGIIQNITQGANALMSVAIVTMGALYVVVGELDVGAMIAANILAARALQPIARFSQLGSAFAKAKQAIEMFEKLSKTPRETTSGSALRSYAGGIEFRDVAFAFPGSTSPLFESLSLKLEPGKVLVVTGANGTGKTTLARLITGLLEPIRGEILVDGLDLKQVAPEWWRRQVVFLPQDPALLNATIEENLKINNPDISASDLTRIVNACGLRRFLDESPRGYETPIVDNGWRLSEGIRRRLALARALTTNGMLVLIDEPTESLDAEGCAAIHQILGALAQKGRTIIVMSHDRNIVKGPHVVVDLNVKPVPAITGPGPYAIAAESSAAAAKRNMPTPQTEFAVKEEKTMEETSAPGVRSFSL
jgi:ATP-binding cassette subfamily C protein LapB